MFRSRLKHQGASEENQPHVSKGGLESSHVHLRLTSHHGIPSRASKLSFDLAQRLLAIGTLDGSIKLLGRAGVQSMLVSDSQVRCKFLEFANNAGHIINITVANDIQIWDLEKRVLVQSHRWHTNITAFAVIQGTPYMYIGEDSGDVAVLQYERGENKLCQMPYSIPVRACLGGLAGSSCDSAPPVVGILPFPESDHSQRVLIAYGNGFIILWGIYEAQIIQARGTGIDQQNQLDGGSSHILSDDEGEEKDIGCICWADPFGNLLAVGYTDGDIWFWDLALTSHRLSDQEASATQSSTPLLKLQISSSTTRSPVLALQWCAVSGGEGMEGVNGHLYVYGGSESIGGNSGFADNLMILSLQSASGKLDARKICHVEVPLTGLFDDMILLPRAGGTLSDPASALLILTSPGQLHEYDESSIIKCFLDLEKGLAPSLPEPVLVNPSLIEPNVTAANLFLLPEDRNISTLFSQLPRSFKGNVPSVLPGGTKWPVSGGILNKAVIEESKTKMVFITGHADGSVNIWDASCSVLYQVGNLPGRVQLELSESSISHVDFCASSGSLAVAQTSGVVSIYSLSGETGEINCLFVNKSEIQDRMVHQDAGFQSIAVLSFGTPVSTIAVASHPLHVAVGYVNGMVLLFDICSRTILFHEPVFCHASPQVRSLTFGPLTKRAETSAQMGSETVSPISGRQSEPLMQRVVFAVAEDASVIAVTAIGGQALISNSWHPVHPSKAVSLHYLELSTQKDMKKHVDSEPSSEQMMDEGDGSVAMSQADLSSCYVLLCTESCVYIFDLSNPQQASFLPLKKASTSISCCWAATIFSQRTNASGLALLDCEGLLQIWSIPDLNIVKEISLSGIFGWETNSPAILSRSVVCSDNGHIALVNANRELMFFSLLANDDSLRIADTSTCLFDKDIAAAADAAFRAGSHPVKRKSQIQEFLGGVLKDLKGGVLKELKGGIPKEIRGGLLKVSKGGKDQSLEINAQTNLSSVFGSSPFTSQHTSPELDKKYQSEVTGSVAINELDIDDIIIEDDDVPSQYVDLEPPSENLVSSIKGKEKLSDTSDDRTKLLGEGEAIRKPVKRTPEEIKAKYGYRSPSGEVSGAAGIARDKLLERQEKLQALSKRTEEMQEGAENFASMAEELAKAMEGKKWWQI